MAQQYTPSFVLTSGAPSLLKDLPFDAALLLPHTFDTSIIVHEDFLSSCQEGFDAYFDNMLEQDREGYVFFVDHFYSWDEVQSFLLQNAFPNPNEVKLAALYRHELTSLPFRVGFCLGWLSALALTDRALALQGLAFLAYLVSLQCSSM